MKMFHHKILFILLILLLSSCKFTINDTDKIRKNIWDIQIIPDKKNCGADESVLTEKITGDFEISPGVIVTLRTDQNQFCLSSYKAQKLPDKVIVKNKDFSAYNFVTLAADRYNNPKKIIFENCRFKGFSNQAVSPNAKGKIYFEFNHCSFCGNVGNSYITLNNCKIGGFTSDAMNPLREFYAKNLYVYDLCHDAKNSELHLDGIQIYGDQRSRNNEINGKWISNVETGEIHFENVRFEIPSINHGIQNKAYVNACVMFQLEFSDVDNVSFKNLYVNGGGKWFPLYMDYGKNNEKSKNGISWSHKNLSMQNVLVSNNFGTIFYPKLLSDAEIKNVKHHSRLFVSSVWKDNTETAHFLVTNDTNTDQILTVKSNSGTFNFEIPHCPSNWALGGEIDSKNNPNESLTDKNGKPYSQYSFHDLPFDLEFTVPGTPTFLIFYQGKEKIRYASLDGKTHFYSEIKK